MKFKNKVTGTIVESNNEFAIEQMNKSDIFEEIKGQIKKTEPKIAVKTDIKGKK